MRRVSSGSIVYYQLDSLLARGVRHAFFTRLGGVSEGAWSSLNFGLSTGDDPQRVRENRLRAWAALDLQESNVATSTMEHGSRVYEVRCEDLRSLQRDPVTADALITADRGVGLTMRFADCLPVLLFDAARGAIGIAHAGWRGIVNGTLRETVRAMQRTFGSRSADLLVGIGPSIGPDRFEVSEDVAMQIQAAVGATPVVSPPSPTCKRWRADLWSAAQAQLRSVGVSQVETMAICTATHVGEWFSHRAEGGRTGRFGVVIALD